MKKKYLQALAETREREAELVALCTDALPDPSRRWRPQDHLRHMSWSRDFEARVIDAVRTGGDLPPKLEEGWQDSVYEATKGEAAAEVIAGAARSWDLIEAAVQATAEEALARPHPHDSSRKLVDGSPSDHLAAHIFWCHIEAGNEKAAEAILRWAQEVSSRTTTDQRTLAVGIYNLACFYARTGRVGEAIPLLRESFERAPDLKDWAHKDPDLDGIRDDQGVIQLLAQPVS